MAAGIDISAAGSGGGSGLEPLVNALDRYSRMLQAVANSLDQIKFPELPDISIKDELQSFLKQLGIITKGETPYAPAKPSDLRYNPELDAALGIGPPVPPSKPAEIAKPEPTPKSEPTAPKAEPSFPKVEPTAPKVEPSLPKVEPTSPEPIQPPKVLQIGRAHV